MPNTITRAFLLGVVAGMRATLGPALVAQQLSRHTSPNLGRLNFMRSAVTATVLKVAAAGELVGDKLPQTPARIEPGPLSGRLVSGALCGAVLSRSAGRKPATGALVGALGALVGASAFYQLRRKLTHKHGMPDVWVALTEDAVAVTGGLLALTDAR